MSLQHGDPGSVSRDCADSGERQGTSTNRGEEPQIVNAHLNNAEPTSRLQGRAWASSGQDPQAATPVSTQGGLPDPVGMP